MSESNDLDFHNQKLNPMNNASRRELPCSINRLSQWFQSWPFSNCKFNDNDVYVNRDEDDFDDDVDDDSDDDDSDRDYDVDDDIDIDSDDDYGDDNDVDDEMMRLMWRWWSWWW